MHISESVKILWRCLGLMLIQAMLKMYVIFGKYCSSYDSFPTLHGNIDVFEQSVYIHLHGITMIPVGVVELYLRKVACNLKAPTYSTNYVCIYLIFFYFWAINMRKWYKLGNRRNRNVSLHSYQRCLSTYLGEEKNWRSGASIYISKI